jgi:outer membrane immunogenic protein
VKRWLRGSFTTWAIITGADNCRRELGFHRLEVGNSCLELGEIMKTFWLGGVATLTIMASLAGQANAADLPAAAPAYKTPAVVPSPAFNWSGFYVGANVGYHFGDQNVDLTAASGTTLALGIPSLATSIGTKRQGVIGGGQIGYNYQLNPGYSWIFGLEADFQGADVNGTSVFDIPTPGGGFFPTRTQVQQDLRNLGTVRGRVGYAFDRLLIYGTGGLAYGQVNNATTVSFFPSGMIGAGTPNVIGFSGNSTQTGYAAGGGGEYALPASLLGSNAVTVRAEYLYYNLGSRTLSTAGISGLIAPGDTLSYRFRNSGQIARLGINLKY